MKVKAKQEYSALKESDNFIGIGHTSTHLRLKAGLEVEVPKGLIPLPKKLLETLTEIKQSSKKSEAK